MENLLHAYKVVLLDLDGTVYHEDHPLPGAIDFLRRLRGQERPFCCISNSTTSAARVAQRLQSMGAPLGARDIYTAADAAAAYVVQQYSPRPHVFNLASDGLQELLEGSVEWVQGGSESCHAVVVGHLNDVYAASDRQRLALALLRRGAQLVGICADRIYPSSRGMEFGSGALTMMLAYAAGVQPVFVGKPEAFFYRSLFGRLAAEARDCVLIGDNLESDVKGAKALGMGAILTLTGVARRQDLAHLPAHLQPDAVVGDLRELL